MTPEPSDSEARRIERDIDHTRARLDQTVDAIQDKLSIRNIAGGIMDRVTDSAQAGSRGIVRSIRENPVPCALIGLGLAWLVMDRNRRPAPRQTFPGIGGPATVGDHLRNAGDTIQSGVQSAGQWAKDAGQKIADAAGDATRHVGEAGHAVYDSARTAAHAAAEKAAMVSGKAREAAQHARQGFWDTYEDNPLIIGAAAFAVGLVSGISVPTTRTEDRLIGRAGKHLKDQAKAVGERAMEAGREVAHRAADAASNAQGDGIGPRLANAAESALSAAAEETGRQARQFTGSREPGRTGDEG